MPRLQYQQSFRAGERDFTFDRDEQLEDRSWSLIKLVGFIIACIALLVWSFQAGRSTSSEGHSRPIVTQAPSALAINIPSQIRIEGRIDANVEIKAFDPPKPKSIWEIPENK